MNQHTFLTNDGVLVGHPGRISNYEVGVSVKPYTGTNNSNKSNGNTYVLHVNVEKRQVFMLFS